MKDYYREKNEEVMDPADVQIMSVTYGYQDPEEAAEAATE